MCEIWIKEKCWNRLKESMAKYFNWKYQPREKRIKKENSVIDSNRRQIHVNYVRVETLEHLPIVMLREKEEFQR